MTPSLGTAGALRLACQRHGTSSQFTWLLAVGAGTGASVTGEIEGVEIGEGAQIRSAIIDKNVRIPRGAGAATGH